MKTKRTSKKWLKYKLGKEHFRMEKKVKTAWTLLYLSLNDLE